MRPKTPETTVGRPRNNLSHYYFPAYSHFSPPKIHIFLIIYIFIFFITASGASTNFEAAEPRGGRAEETTVFRCLPRGEKLVAGSPKPPTYLCAFLPSIYFFIVILFYNLFKRWAPTCHLLRISATN